MRVVIGGGLGYIGSAVCERVRRRPEHPLTVVDRRVVAERVVRFPDHVRFVQGDLRDTRAFGRLLRDADVFFLLAEGSRGEDGVDAESSAWESQFELPKRLVEVCPSHVRIVFASTGEVFGGLSLDDPSGMLTEDDEPRPRYAAAEAKLAIERLLKRSGRDFAVLRFGSVYGLAPGIRFDLPANAFARQALLGQDVVVEGDGMSRRPNVCVHDCARALFFAGEAPRASGETFHVAVENVRIRVLAERIIVACGALSSQVRLRAQEVPLGSYGLSSQKLQRLGFRFMWNLETAVGEMKKAFRGWRRLGPST